MCSQEILRSHSRGFSPTEADGWLLSKVFPSFPHPSNTMVDRHTSIEVPFIWSAKNKRPRLGDVCLLALLTSTQATVVDTNQLTNMVWSTRDTVCVLFTHLVVSVFDSHQRECCLVWENVASGDQPLVTGKQDCLEHALVHEEVSHPFTHNNVHLRFTQIGGKKVCSEGAEGFRGLAICQHSIAIFCRVYVRLVHNSSS